MSDPKPLTRKELSEFLPDQRSIRAFEKLFQIVPDEIEIISTETGGSYSKAVQANTIAIDALTRVRGANVLLWLSM